MMWIITAVLAAISGVLGWYGAQLLFDQFLGLAIVAGFWGGMIFVGLLIFAPKLVFGILKGIRWAGNWVGKKTWGLIKSLFPKRTGKVVTKIGEEVKTSPGGTWVKKAVSTLPGLRKKAPAPNSTTEILNRQFSL